MNIAYIPEFLASIISLDILASKGTYWSTKRPDRLSSDNYDIKLCQIGSHWVLDQPNNQTFYDNCHTMDLDPEPIESIPYESDSEDDNSTFASTSER